MGETLKILLAGAAALVVIAIAGAILVIQDVEERAHPPIATPPSQDRAGDVVLPAIILQDKRVGWGASSAAWVPGGKHMITASNGLLVWDLEKRAVIGSLGQESAGMNHVAFTSDGKTMISAGYAGWAMWSLPDFELVRRHNVNEALALAIAPGDGTFATGGPDHTIRIWSLPVGKLLRELKHGTKGEVTALGFTPDGSVLASAGTNFRAKLWRVERGEVLHNLAHQGPVSDLALIKDGATLVTASHDRRLRFWNVADGNLMRTVEGHHDEIWSLAVAPDEQTLVTVGEEELIRIWRVSDGLLLDTRLAPDASMRFVEFSPDGKTFVATPRTNRVDIWNAPRPEAI